MAELDHDLIQRFKEVLESLPADKRMEMYNRLKSLNEDERNAAMRAIVEKAGAVHAKGQTGSSAKPQPKPVRAEHSNEAPKANPQKKLKKKYSCRTYSHISS